MTCMVFRKLGQHWGQQRFSTGAGSDKAPCKGIEITCEFVLGQFSVGWFVCFLSNWDTGIIVAAPQFRLNHSLRRRRCIA